jgi:long-chain acyl-CoA synthetase
MTATHDAASNLGEADIDVAALSQQLTVGDLVRENRRRFPQREAFVCQDARITYPELDDRVSRLANALRELSVGPGDRVLWLAQNCHRFFELMFACAKIGAAVCPVNWRQTLDEMEHIFTDFAPKVVMWQEEEIGDVVRDLRARVADEGIWLQHDADGPGSYENAVAAASDEDDERPVPMTSSLLAIYTAGFDGRPKAAMLNHQCIVSISLVQGLVMGVSPGTDDIFLNSGPFFHIGDIVHALPYFHFGGLNVLLRRMDGAEACRLIESEKITSGYLFGPIADIIAEANRDGRYDLSSLRVPTSMPVLGAMSPKHAAPISGFGQTEVGGRVTFTAFGGAGEGSAGRTSPLAQVRIFDPAGHEVAIGEAGELAIRGPVVMNGYLNAETDRRQPLGWRRTGDLGRRHEDGSISFVGVARRMLKSGVENIYPAEVEAVIRSHPEIAEVAIIGVPDERWAQSVRAIVVRTEDGTVTEEEVIAFCRERMSSYKKPKSIIFVAELPKTNGAIDYAQLDRNYEGGGYPGM